MVVQRVGITWPGCFVPELNGKQLVLTFDVIAKIYLNEITTWDDPRIKAINSADVADVLPSQPITVTFQTVASAATTVITAMLNATVPGWSSAVRTCPTTRLIMGSSRRSFINALLVDVHVPNLDRRKFAGDLASADSGQWHSVRFGDVFKLYRSDATASILLWHLVPL